MTWKDVKLATLQKMFAAEGATIPTDESTEDYLAGMPYVANEALQRLSTAGKFITKSIVIAHNPLNNLIPDKEAMTIHNLGNMEFTAEGASSYYFEFSGKGILSIDAENLHEEVSLDSKGTYTEYRGIINGDYCRVVLGFKCSYPSTVKNVALYEAQFESEDEVPEYGKQMKYFLKKICSDFYQIGHDQIYYEGSDGCGCFQTSRYYRDSDNVLLLDRNYPGSYTIQYRAYPEEITANTKDDYVLPLDKEVAVLMPLYMASQLYKDDDNGIATSYRNEFEVALESLVNSGNSQGYEELVNESGWI